MSSFVGAVRKTISDHDRQNDGLAADVAAAMYERVGRRAAQLDVSASDGLVTLRGVLKSFYEKQLMLHAAKNVAGVSALCDELVVVSDRG